MWMNKLCYKDSGDTVSPTKSPRSWNVGTCHFYNIPKQGKIANFFFWFHYVNKRTLRTCVVKEFLIENYQFVDMNADPPSFPSPFKY